MYEPTAPSPHHWIVCLTHFKCLQNCVWQAMQEAPSDVMRTTHKPCDQCLSEVTGDAPKNLSLHDPSGSHVDMSAR